MKIRHPFVIRLVGFLASWVIRVWIGSLAYRRVGEDWTPLCPGLDQRFIYAFWHENILLPCCYYAHRDVRVLISQHADGEIIAQVCRHLGFGTIRGSATRGGMVALRKMIRASQTGHICVVPDGPRGPRRHVELGMVYLAAKTGLPIVLAGVGYDRPWRLKTWDRFALPRPWSQAVMMLLPPVTVPADADAKELEAWRVYLEETLSALSDHAERLASR